MIVRIAAMATLLIIAPPGICQEGGYVNKELDLRLKVPGKDWKLRTKDFENAKEWEGILCELASKDSDIEGILTHTETAVKVGKAAEKRERDWKESNKKVQRMGDKKVEKKAGEWLQCEFRIETEETEFHYVHLFGNKGKHDFELLVWCAEAQWNDLKADIYKIIDSVEYGEETTGDKNGPDKKSENKPEPEKKPDASGEKAGGRSTPEKPEEQEDISLEEKLLATLPDEKIHPRDIVLSHNGKSVAYILKEGENNFVVTPTGKSEAYDSVRDLQFMADGLTPVYVAQKGGKRWVVVGDKKLSEDLHPRAVYLGPDRKRMAVVADLGRRREFLVVGDTRGEEFIWVGDVTFSPDGKTVAYQADKGKKFIVIGDKKGKGYDDVGVPVFSPDGKTVAYLADEKGYGYLVVGDTEKLAGSPFQGSLRPAFGSDGKIIAYPSKGTKKVVMYVKDKEEEYFEFVGSPLVSPDGSTVAYWAAASNSEFLVLGGKKIQSPGTVRNPAFSPDGKQVAFVALQGKQLMILGEKKGEPFDEVWAPAFSRDGAKVGFGARKGRELWWKAVSAK